MVDNVLSFYTCKIRLGLVEICLLDMTFYQQQKKKLIKQNDILERHLLIFHSVLLTPYEEHKMTKKIFFQYTFTFFNTGLAPYPQPNGY